MNIFCNRTQALESEYIVLIPPQRPTYPVQIFHGVNKEYLAVLKIKHPNLVAFKKEVTND